MVNARLDRQHAPITVHAEELHPLDFLQPPAAFRHLGGPGSRHQDGRRGIGRGGDVQEETAALELPGGLDLAADAAAAVSRSGSFRGTPGTCRSHQYGGFARGVKICWIDRARRRPLRPDSSRRPESEKRLSSLSDVPGGRGEFGASGLIGTSDMRAS